MNSDGRRAKTHGNRSNGTPNRISRIAVMGVGAAAVVMAGLSVSTRFVGANVVDTGTVHVAPQAPQGDTIALAPSMSGAARATDRLGQTGKAQDRIVAQPQTLSQQAFSLRFKTYDASPVSAKAVGPVRTRGGDVVLASLGPAAERFGGSALGAAEDSPLKAALEARRTAYVPSGALAEVAALDPEAFVLPQEVPLPTGRPRATVAKAPDAKPAPDAVATVAPAKPSHALLAVVESLPSVESLVTRVKPRKPAAEKPAKSTTIVRSRNKVLAYASPNLEDKKKAKSGGLLANLFSGDGGKSSKKSILSNRRSGVAIYDISAAVVHMPNGEKLEAHSGLGHMKDNPKYAHRRMKGPTPPNVYNLRMREKRYHGVEAIRMLPTNHKMMKGRDGILAHTSLVRGTNGSHGCVAFKNYDKFLKAFKRGEVKKIVVVPRMSEAKTYLAML